MAAPSVASTSEFATASTSNNTQQNASPQMMRSDSSLHSYVTSGLAAAIRDNYIGLFIQNITEMTPEQLRTALQQELPTVIGDGTPRKLIDMIAHYKRAEMMDVLQEAISEWRPNPMNDASLTGRRNFEEAITEANS